MAWVPSSKRIERIAVSETMPKNCPANEFGISVATSIVVLSANVRWSLIPVPGPVGTARFHSAPNALMAGEKVNTGFGACASLARSWYNPPLMLHLHALEPHDR